MSRPAAQCALCRNLRLLSESHFLPKALYKLVRDPASGKSVFMGATDRVDTTRQVKKYLLCEECEDRFNARGENWVQANSLGVDGSFPIRTALLGTQAIDSVDYDVGRNVSMYCGVDTPAVDIDRLIYFAVSVFWRASVTDWPIAGRTLNRIRLGSYQEQLRAFLMDEAAFPEYARLVLYVASEERPMRAACFPTGFRQEGRYFKYTFHIPGLGFVLCLGQRIPQVVRTLCAARSGHRPVFLSDMGDRALGDLFTGFLTAKQRR